MEAAGYQGPDDRQAFVEAIEAMTDMPAAPASTRRATRSSTARPTRSSATSTISKVEGGKLAVVHTTSIEDGLYPDEVDYTTQSF